jgi:uncharacterized membrane protein YqiK
MKLRVRLKKLEARQGGKATCATPAQRDALDRLAAAIASSGEAEAKARRDLAEMLVDFQL